jgi:bifunctional UDP-N-acetylglucosamine pyrophosphorylase/glucosamine-1-phosphate N-acetyltransferase/UDP-N-acetylglucosamine pyrophosphorylase
MNDPVAIVLAAGQGTRMRSPLPKVLVEVCGRPMVDYVLDALRRAGVRRILVVVGYRGDLVRAALADQPGVEFVEQTEQHGTGHAVMVCRRALGTPRGAVLILTGDSPLVQADSLRALLDLHARERPACILGTAYKDDPHGLGRIVRDARDAFVRIVEERDATEDERRIREVNMSTYVFDAPELLHALAQLTRANNQGEYYITDCPGILRREGKDVRAVAVLKPCEALSINTPEELARVAAEMQRLVRH